MTPFALSPDAHPIMQAGFAYWQAARPAADLLPGRQHVDPLHIPSLLPHVWLIEIHPAAAGTAIPRFRFRLIGSHIDLGFGDTKTGRWLDEIEPAFADTPAMHTAWVACAREAIPHHRRGTPNFRFNRNARELERMMLPLAADGRTVDMLLGFTVFFDNRGGILQPAL